MNEPAVLLEAAFDPKVKLYWIWQPVLFLTLFIFTIPIAIIYAIVAGFVTGRYLANLHCTLTERTLDIKKGIWNKTESTIPLEKITDLQLFQGPVMRFFGVHGFKVETAGQSSAPGGSLVNIVGIVDTKGFRRAVLAQRDRMNSVGPTAPRSVASELETAAADPRTAGLLTEIRDSLKRIEAAVVRSDDP